MIRITIDCDNLDLKLSNYRTLDKGLHCSILIKQNQSIDAKKLEILTRIIEQEVFTRLNDYFNSSNVTETQRNR